MKHRRSPLRAVVVAGAAALGLVLVPSAMANHPVYVEGNCLNPPAGNPTPPGDAGAACGDWDGDGRIGTAEDADGDRVFGTIAAALGGGTGANQNGSVTVVTSGVFAEVVSITAANGNVTLQAAPGVEANVDAVLQGDAGSGGRQAAPGIVVNAPSDRYVTIRNIMSRNWTSGFRILGKSRVTLDGVRAENNVNFGIEIADQARVVISNSSVQATGARAGATGDFPRTSLPNPGKGIEFDDDSSGTVCFSTVSGSFRAGIDNEGGRTVTAYHLNAFDNRPNLDEVELRKDCTREWDDRKRDDDGIFGIGGTSGGWPLILAVLGLVGLALTPAFGHAVRRTA